MRLLPPLFASLGLTLSTVSAVLATQQAEAAADSTAESWIRQGLEANAQAQSLQSWMAQDLTLSRFLKEAVARGSDPARTREELCRALTGLDPLNLALYEEELDEHVSDLSCAPELTSRLEEYWSFRETELALERASPGKYLYPAPQERAARLGPSQEIHIDSSKGETLYGSPGEGYVREKQISITIDDGPHRRYTRKILDSLARYGVRANFFSMGENAEKMPSIVRAAVAEGHVVGSHSMTHKNLKSLHKRSPENAYAEISAGAQAVADAAGLFVPFFRFPYGAHNAGLDAFLKKKEMTSFLWNIDTLDWKKRDPEELLAYSLRKVSEVAGGILLIHDIQRQTAIMLPYLLEELESRKYSTVVFVPH